MASLLRTHTDGPVDAARFLILHDRYGGFDTARELGREHLGETIQRISVQSPRAQTTGGLGFSYGRYWYVGPLNRPELSTFGDGLYQLEQLVTAQSKRGPVGLLGFGEGANMALVMTMLWPELLTATVLVKPVLPENFDRMPVDQQELGGLPILLVNSATDVADTLAARGAQVARGTVEDIAAFVAKSDRG